MQTQAHDDRRVRDPSGEDEVDADSWSPASEGSSRHWEGGARMAAAAHSHIAVEDRGAQVEVRCDDPVPHGHDHGHESLHVAANSILVHSQPESLLLGAVAVAARIRTQT